MRWPAKIVARDALCSLLLIVSSFMLRLAVRKDWPKTACCAVAGVIVGYRLLGRISREIPDVEIGEDLAVTVDEG